MTWEQFCAEYTPGRYSRDATAEGIADDIEDLRIMLHAAHFQLDQLDALVELPHRRSGNREETSAGSCYGSAA